MECHIRGNVKIQMVEHGMDKNILGCTYEYCFAKLAEHEGKPAGEFYTPSCVVQTLIEVMKPILGRVYEFNIYINRLKRNFIVKRVIS